MIRNFYGDFNKKVIEDKLPALLSSLKLSLVVEERINAMQVEEVEELVLSIMIKNLVLL